MWYVCCCDYATIRVYAQQPGVYMEFKQVFPSALRYDPDSGILLSNVVPFITQIMEHAPTDMVHVSDGKRLGSYMAAGNTLLYLDASRFALIDRVEDPYPGKPIFVVRARDTSDVFELCLSNGGKVDWKSH